MDGPEQSFDYHIGDTHAHAQRWCNMIARVHGPRSARKISEIYFDIRVPITYGRSPTHTHKCTERNGTGDLASVCMKVGRA